MVEDLPGLLWMCRKMEKTRVPGSSVNKNWTGLAEFNRSSWEPASLPSRNTVWVIWACKPERIGQNRLNWATRRSWRNHCQTEISLLTCDFLIPVVVCNSFFPLPSGPQWSFYPIFALCRRQFACDGRRNHSCLWSGSAVVVVVAYFLRVTVCKWVSERERGERSS